MNNDELIEPDFVIFEAHDFRDKMSLVVSRDDDASRVCLYVNLTLRQFRSFRSKLSVIREYLFNNSEYISQELILSTNEIKDLRDKLDGFLQERAERIMRLQSKE